MNVKMAELTPEGIRAANVANAVREFHRACITIEANAGAPALAYAVGYARAGRSMFDPEAIRVQCLYLLNNITKWRGETAKHCRETLRRLSRPEAWA
jgi:hypothetical protein